MSYCVVVVVVVVVAGVQMHLVSLVSGLCGLILTQILYTSQGHKYIETPEQMEVM